MEILFTALSLACLVGCFLAFTRAQHWADRAESNLHATETALLKARNERDRVTVLERDVEALRRELRKLSGKFYATARQDEADDARHFARKQIDAFPATLQNVTPLCANWGLAQIEGPRSEAASCECAYCVTQRNIRSVEKAAILAARNVKPVTGGE